MSIPEGAIDIHVHAGPSYFDRFYDSIALARDLQETPMTGVVLKSHFGSTFEQAVLAADRVSGVELFPSMTLNTFTGGFNPSAAELALETGAVVLWMPTFSAANFHGSYGREYPFTNQSLTVFEEAGTVRDDVRTVFETIANASQDIAIGNGHLAPDETTALLDLMEELGLDVPFLVTHADFEFMGLSVDDQTLLADRGAFIEKTYLPIIHGDISIDQMVTSINEIGSEQCVLSTDHGQRQNAPPPQSYGTFLADLRHAGVDDADIEVMSVRTPRELLGLDSW